MNTSVTATPTPETVSHSFFATSTLAQWWIKLINSAPALASAIGTVTLLRGTLPLAHSREAIWMQAGRRGYGPGWVYVAAGAPWAQGLRSMALGAAYSLPPAAAFDLADFLGSASSSHVFGELLHAASLASRDWSIEEVEGRLGMPLIQAYSQGGALPNWAGPGPFNPSVTAPCPPDGCEPHGFIYECVDGIWFEDTLWSPYARALFPDVFS
jgi:hypothetical protein